jgi:hypothetical protein
MMYSPPSRTTVMTLYYIGEEVDAEGEYDIQITLLGFDFDGEQFGLRR